MGYQDQTGMKHLTQDCIGLFFSSSSPPFDNLISISPDFRPKEDFPNAIKKEKWNFHSSLQI